jgi:hypothetical protein
VDGFVVNVKKSLLMGKAFLQFEKAFSVQSPKGVMLRKEARRNLVFLYHPWATGRVSLI